MRNALLVTRRELGAYIRSPLGCLVVAAALLIDAIWLYTHGFGMGSGKQLSSDVLREFFFGASGTTMIASVILTMRLLAGERENGTLVLLNTAPIRDVEIVAGKFLAALTVIAVTSALSVYMPALIFVNGKVSVGHILVGYSGVLLLGAAALSIGLFASSLARTQIVAIIVGAVMLAVMVVLWLVARVTDPPLNTFLSGLALHHERFRPFMIGVLKLENVVFYLAVAYLFLFATTKTLEARRWR
jgi:ABC-2 type transport system permease protein